MEHIENIIVGTPEIHPHHFFAYNEADWNDKESKLTKQTDERFLPRILVDLGIAKSTSQVRKNRPELFIELNEPDFLEVKWGKQFLWIMVN